MAARLVRKRPVNMGDVVRMLKEFVNTRAMIDKLTKKVDDKDTGLGLKQQLITSR